MQNQNETTKIENLTDLTLTLAQLNEANLQKLALREKKSPFKNFYQVNKDQTDALLRCSDNPQAMKLWLFICSHMDKFNAVMCSHKVLAEALKTSVRSISRSVKYLKDNGYIYIYKSGVSNVYVANDSLVWNSWGSNTKYCEFPANIVLSSSEQEKDIQDKLNVQDKVVKKLELNNENGFTSLHFLFFVNVLTWIASSLSSFIA